MEHQQTDTKNAFSTKSFHPLQFALWVIIFIVSITVGVHYLIRPEAPVSPPLTVNQLNNNTPIMPSAPWQTITVQKGDTLATIFKRLGFSISDYQQTTKLPEIKKITRQLKPGQTIDFLTSPKHELQQMVYKLNNTQSLEVTYYQNESPTLKTITPEFDKKLETVSGTIQKSFMASAEKDGLPAKLAAQFILIFNNTIDFRRDVHSGDKFAVIYDEYYVGDKKSHSGDIVAAEILHQNKLDQAIRYEPKNGKESYYTPNGKSILPLLMRAPLHYKRISSYFNERRMHPILHIIRPHEGIDYAAPSGTPIKAAGDGKIIFRGRKGGYGKAIIIQHADRYSTLYAHMSRFDDHLHTGSSVKEGQVIGYVGQTGLADGPHLHFEIRINGIHYNPLTVKLPPYAVIAKKDLPAFTEYAQDLIHMMNRILAA